MPKVHRRLPADARDFLELLQTRLAAALPGFFAAGEPLWVTRAPGRLDVMGGIADYCGALVLQLPLAEATLVALQPADDGQIRLASVPEDGAGQPRQADLSLGQIIDLARDSFEQAQAWFRRDDLPLWAAHVAGVLIVLARHYTLPRDRGLRILVQSHVPEGKGLGSSAALEVASLQALAHHFGIALTGIQLAHLCQQAETRVLGTACGIRDQMTAAVGNQDQLLALLCQPAEVHGSLPLPSGIRVWGIESGVAPEICGAGDLSARTGALMGYRILADLAGLEVHPPDSSGVVRVVDPLWRGYLVNVGAAEFDRRFADRLPQEISGAEFLARYGGTADPAAPVDPQRTYPVYQATVHPIQEHERVRQFVSLLAGPLTEAALVELGQLMYASHESYSACGRGSAETDMLVEMVRAAGWPCGLYGAKITGPGRGGPVAVLGAEDAEPVVQDIAARYAREIGRQVTVFAGSSGGAVDFGILRLDEFRPRS